MSSIITLYSGLFQKEGGGGAGAQRVPKINHCYSLSDSSLAITFATFFVTKRSSFPSKLGKHVRSTTTCMYKQLFCLNSAKC